jgi:cytochrome P450
VPARVTMLAVGLPMDMAESLEAAVHTIDGAGPESNDPEQAAAFEAILEVIATAIGAARQRSPEDTVMSRLVYLADDHGLTDEDITSVALSVILGGIGTTRALLGHALHHLDDNRAHRQALIQDPGLLPMAIEELLRTFPPVVGMARTVAKDTVLGGERLRRGERVYLLYASANRDERAFSAPDEIVLDRRGNRHTTFGLGIHRCLGSNLARAEIGIVLSEILRRMPDYALDRDGLEPYETVGRMDGYRRLLATFTPGSKTGQQGPTASSTAAG